MFVNFSAQLLRASSYEWINMDETGQDKCMKTDLLFIRPARGLQTGSWLHFGWHYTIESDSFQYAMIRNKQ